MDEKDSNLDFSVALIGLAGRFPGAKSVHEFWENLVNEKESISFFTDAELIESRVDPKMISHSSYVRARGVLGDSDCFDASFFGYSPREAEILDPQHRVFLECAWHAMEDAGYNPFKTAAKIGVFGGTGAPLHHLEISKNPHLQSLANGMSIIVGNEKDYLATRIAYKLNLTGTSISVQCACSTSLSAIVLGMQSLLTHQNDMVLAGGVSINFPEKQGYLYEKGGLDSPDGHCRTFDARAQGTVFSSGAGVVLLKRLSDAIRDRDNIYCILKGGSINNDGSLKASYTAPSVNGQVAVEVDALEMSGVNPETIGYVEAHGTATQLGDPIEVKALSQAFQQYTLRNNFCAIGSVKTNIGHTDVASGVIGVIKVAMALKKKIIPASLHFETPNPQIDFANSPFYVNVKTKSWEATKDHPRRAMINSFGVGGTNACLILEEAPVMSLDVCKREHFILPLSAKTGSALDQISSNISKYVTDHPEVDLSDLTYTLQVGRALFEHRKLISFSNRGELIDRLIDPSNKSVLSMVSNEKGLDPIFVFPGQGNQYFGMGRELYLSETYFREQVDYCCKILNEKLAYEYDLMKMFFCPEEVTQYKLLVDQTIVAQPALFVVEFALAKFLIFMGVSPKALVGHSIGEFVAACIAEVISVEDALMTVVARARMTQQLPKGSMLAIFAERERVSQWVRHPNEIAVVNSPKLTVVSGPTNEISQLEDELSTKGISCKKLSTSHAFHSHMMNELIQPLFEIISKVKLSSPKIPIMSTVTGKWMTDQEAKDPTYWAQHARKPVDFVSAATRLLDENNDFYIEVGPGHSLESSIKNCSDSKQNKIVGLMGGANSPIQESHYFYTALGKIWALGGTISLENLYRGRRISLPGYPFERKQFLLDFKHAEHAWLDKKSGRKEDIGDWFYFPLWKKTIPLNDRFDFDLRSENNNWIIFINKNEISLKLIERLRNLNQNVYSVQPGHSFQEEDRFSYFIDPANRDDYSKLFNKIDENPGDKYRIIYLWTLDQISFSLDFLSRAEIISFYGPLFLEQALIRLNKMGSVHLTFVANDVYNVIGDEVDVIKSLIIGPCRSLKNEYNQVQSRLIDISIPRNANECDQFINTLICENLHVSDEIVVAYRNFTRWLPVYESTYVPSENLRKRSFKEGGIYIITGGMGSLGLVLAKCIAENVNAILIFIQRSSFPLRSEWDSWLKCQAKDDAICNKIKEIMKIEALGSSVVIETADIASLPEMEALLQRILSSYHKVDGVLHCAGVPSGNVIALTSPEKAADVLKPKVRGTLILDKLLKGQDLDFFISASSITGILGEKGQVDYCSANAFLDAFANSKTVQKPGVYASLNWGPWEIGMAALDNFKNDLSKPMNSLEAPLKRLQVNFNELGEEDYQVVLNQDQDWFIHNHRLKGIPTMVGTAFFEFLWEYTKEKEPQGVCLISNVRFVFPLMFYPGSQRLLKLKVLNQNDVLRFKFVSHNKKDAKDKNEIGQEHLHGEISTQKEKVDQYRDLGQLIGRLEEDFDCTKIHDDDPGSALWVGSRWKSAKRVFKGDKEWLAHLELPSVFGNDMRHFSVHPALLDFATSFSLAYSAKVLHLPYSYEQIAIFHPIENEVFSYARQRDSGEDFVVLDIDVMNKEGKLLVQVKGYMLKSVSDSFRFNRQNDSAKEILANIFPAEGAEAFKRFFYQILTPQVVISSEDFNDLIKENQPSIENVNSKDKEKLIKHTRPQLFNPYSAPSNEVESVVAEIWEGVLGMTKLGVDDNFIELGGNSLSALQIVTQITERYDVNFNVESFLANQTIRTTSDFIINQLIEMIDEEKLNEILSTERV